jgi:protein tyrosine/serine phosphatase
MEKLITLLLFLIAITLLVSNTGCDTKSQAASLGYQISEKGDKITFIFDEKTQNQTLVTKIHVAGSFSSWDISDYWVLEQSGTKGVWILTVPVKIVNIPGNSGYPEFKFVVNGSKWINSIAPAGYQFTGNTLIVYPGDDIEQIITNEKIAKTIKKLDEFDLTKEKDKKIIANFRLVPGTDKLFRSYHPFKKSRLFDTENPRIEMINELMESNSVQSIISLSEREKPQNDGELSAYLKNIFDHNHVLFVDSSYDTVYYQSDSSDFANQIKKIVEFIIDPEHQAPFLVHCRIGTDRTGVVSAVLAAFCGASWDSICADYQKSNDMGIDEFRDYKLLQYSFENMLKMKIDENINLKIAVSKYFTNEGYLSSEQIEALNQKLKN